MGEVKIKWIHIFNVILAIAIAIVVGVLFVSVQHFNSDPAYAKSESVTQNVNDGWYQISDDGTISKFDDFSRRLDINELTLSRIFIFGMDEERDALRFKAYYSAVEVYQDGILIYSHGSIDDVKSGTILGVNECIVPLNIYYGEASEIEVHLISNMTIKINPFFFGKTGDFVTEKFGDALITTLFSISLIVISLIMLVFAFIGRKRLKFSFDYYYFVTFLVFVSIWAITDTQLLGALGVTSGIVSILSYECFAFMMLPFMVYMYYSNTRLRTVDLCMVILLFANFIIVNVLHFAKALNLVQSVLSSQILITLSLGLVIFQSLYSFIKDKDLHSIVMTTSVILVMAGAVVQLIDFYGVNRFNSTDFLLIGILLFVVLQVGSLLSGVFKLIDEGRMAKDYLNMAMTDPLTGLGNRRGLDAYISSIAKSPTPFYRLGCIVCDLNDLKKTNDVYGHDVGDRLIKDFADCLQVCFENRGKVFRTGGDEFYIIFSDVEVDMSAMMRRLSICLDGSNVTAEYKISCSRGCYADYVAANNEDAVWDIIKFADAEMYKMKKADRAKRRVDEPSEE
ncbi:MAG: GGDEF domain-containing protein [Sphaerochaetaceae bacterium]|nr:GGDEF domain-containing protein [Sphaerochaetaceae bacterium]